MIEPGLTSMELWRPRFTLDARFSEWTATAGMTSTARVCETRKSLRLEAQSTSVYYVLSRGRPPRDETVNTKHPSGIDAPISIHDIQILHFCPGSCDVSLDLHDPVSTTKLGSSAQECGVRFNRCVRNRPYYNNH
jgi:hypothetical protein